MVVRILLFISLIGICNAQIERSNYNKLDKDALADSILARNLVDRQELDDTSQAIHQAIIDSSGAIRSYADLKLDKSALKDSINSRNLVYEPELDDSTSAIRNAMLYKSLLKDSINSRNLVYEPELDDTASAIRQSLVDTASAIRADIGNANYAPIASPTFTGTLTAPTINATTAFQLNGTNINTIYESLTNKVTSISGSSTDVQYPSAKLLYDQLALKSNKSTKQVLFQTALDSSLISTTDTIPLGYTPQTGTIDTVIIISYGATAPDYTMSVYHSNNTAIFSGAQTINAKGITKKTSFADSTFVSGNLYLVFPSVTTIPTRNKLAVYIVGTYGVDTWEMQATSSENPTIALRGTGYIRIDWGDSTQTGITLTPNIQNVS